MAYSYNLFVISATFFLIIWFLKTMHISISFGKSFPFTAEPNKKISAISLKSVPLSFSFKDLPKLFNIFLEYYSIFLSKPQIVGFGVLIKQGVHNTVSFK